MIGQIEELLLRKTENKRSRIFHTQWQLAKEYIPQLLSVISHTFPHYSLHDQTHSDTIINNIVRIIGKGTLEKLSAVDLWLLISSAYYHDLGMAVFALDKLEIFKSEDFVDFISQLQEDSHSPLNEFSNCLEIKDKKVYFKNDELNIKNFDSSRFILAEYIRKKHSERSHDSIVKNISMNLPGSPIPKRIIEVLASICRSHTQTFENVMDLPLAEVGIDSDDCHPRYIACLLRLGDLLDMDNNRFSEVLLQTLDSIPLDSIQHKEKHLSIKHIRIDNDRIEATAVCDKYEIADLANRWFELLDNEMSNQMKRWNDIVPDSSFGFLPTLGKLVVELKNFDTIDGKLRPSFKIDSSKSIELLQGAGLYSEPYQCIRELLQNSTDATLLRIFSENEQKAIENKKDDFIEYSKGYPIDISITRGKILGNKIEWHITISDNGIGLSKNDLSYLTTTGSSNKNIEKKKLMDRMPEWMKPSGTFGIGFQSVFLLTEEVTLTTKKFNKEAVLRAKLFNPAGKNDGAVLLQTLTDEIKKVGTELSFVIVSEKDPNAWSIKSEQETASRVVNSYDFVNDDSLDIDVAKIVDEIYKFSRATYIPINLKIDDQDLIKLTPEKENLFQSYCEEKYIELSILSSEYQNRTYYRNQFVEKSVKDFKFLSFAANILGGNAKEILTLNRNEIKYTYKSKLSEDIIDSALLILKQKFEGLDSEMKPKASMFIEYYSSDKLKAELFEDKDYSDWKKYEFIINNKAKTINDIISYYDKIIFKSDNQSFNKTPRFEANEKTLTIQGNDRNEFVEFLCLKALKKLKHVTFSSYLLGKERKREITLSKVKENDLILDWEFWFNRYWNQSHYARGLMPCIDKYKRIQLDKKFMMPMAYDNTFYGFHNIYPLMICPYIRIYEHTGFYGKVESLNLDLSDKLIDIVFDNRADKSVTKDAIKQTYQNFVEDMKDIVSKVNEKY